MVYEFRRYELLPGQGGRMVDRFNRVFAQIFAKHGWELLGAWTDREEADRFYVLMRFPSEEERQRAWVVYHEDPMYVDSGDDLSTIIKDLHIHLLDRLDGGLDRALGGPRD